MTALNEIIPGTVRVVNIFTKLSGSEHAVNNAWKGNSVYIGTVLLKFTYNFYNWIL